MTPRAVPGVPRQNGDADRVQEHLRRADSLRAAGRPRDALAELEAAARLKPDDVAVLIEQAQLYLALDESVDAHDCYQLALAHAPDHPAALLGLARMLRSAGDWRAALAHIVKAARLAPATAEIHFERALIQQRCDDLSAAAAAYRQGLELDPHNYAAWTNLGLLYLSGLGDPAHARECFERAIQLEPAGVEAQANLGLALEEEGRIDAALNHYEKLIEAHPAESEYRWNRGLALLASGDYARGWDDYEMRNARGRGPAPRTFPYPVWDGSELPEGAALLIYAEQGLGDEIMFASCVPDLIARGIECLIECDARLAGLFARSFPAARVHGAPRDGDRRWLKEFPDVIAQCAIGSLPRILRRAAGEFPRHSGYLVADASRVAAWQARLDSATKGPTVGLAWRGGTRGTRSELRSIPLTALAPLTAPPRVTFVNLQREGAPALIEWAKTHGVSALNFDEALGDVEETAALCKALGHIVTVDNSLAHLAGALGCPTSILISHSSDWRWLRGQSKSPWYPSVTLFRQATPGNWTDAVQDAGKALLAKA